MIKIPSEPFEEDDKKEELTDIIRKMSRNINYLIEKSAKQERKIFKLEKEVISKRTEEEQEKINEELKEEKFRSYTRMCEEADTDVDVYSDSEESKEIFKEKRKEITFENTCKQLNPKMLEENKNKIKIKEYRKEQKEKDIKERKEREDKTMNELVPSKIKDIEYPKYEFIDLKENMNLKQIDTGLFVTNTKIKGKEIINTESNLGKIKKTENEKQSIAEKYNDNITHREQSADDIAFKDEIKKYMKEKNLKLPMKDPSRDPISQEFANVIVRIKTVNGKKKSKPIKNSMMKQKK